ncbi:hypothetical protein ECSTECS1191_3354 [Escherichia coli STEC_S1191]|nr:hypothetical protein ECSTECS1191_3354 [Escherichia coli STEC_S1191]
MCQLHRIDILHALKYWFYGALDKFTISSVKYKKTTLLPLW